MRSFLAAILAVLILGVVACGGGGGDDDQPTPADFTPTQEAADEEEDGSAIDKLADVRLATVRIVASGSFVDPDFGQQNNVAGSGSGFIISSDGIAITNNHVVTGAAFLEVYVGGDEEARNARILGVSECSDLAVIDIEGDGYRYLDWYEGAIDAGLKIYAAGYPLGVEEYTLLDGIIARADAGGETTWSSVDRVVEHTADTLPGSSGGPIVTDDGRVVAINYAGDSERRSFAIAHSEAREIIGDLREGQDVTSIGVNGAAVANADFTGVWVSSVETGSPAHAAGIRAGDLITRLEGLILAEDGTMADYCDILRSHLPTDALAVEVLRPATLEVLEGTLNGDALKVTTTFAQEVEDRVQDTPDSSTYEDYVEVTDDSGLLSVSVPGEWSDLSRLPWEFEGETVGYSIVASPDIAGWYDTWDVPGIFFGASEALRSRFEPTQLLDLETYDFSASCTYDGRSDYEDALYVGSYDLWLDCGGTGAILIVLAAEPFDGSFIILLQAIAIYDEDLDAVDTVLNTFIAGF
jgi:serine protease Do